MILLGAQLLDRKRERGGIDKIEAHRFPLNYLGVCVPVVRGDPPCGSRVSR